VVEEVTPVEFDERRRAGESWQLLDVREAWECALASVDGALYMPLHELPARLGELDPGLPVAVLCHSGIRSALAAGYLARTGFDRVANITGGIDAWSLDLDHSIPRY